MVKSFLVSRSDRTRCHKALACEIAKDVLIDTAIYEHNRLWRIPNTKHGKSGLYKVPLTSEQLATWSVTRIRELAAKPPGKPGLTLPVPDSGSPHTKLRDIYEKAAARVRSRATVKPHAPIHHLSPDILQRPCIRRLLHGVETGKRNEAAMRLAAAFKKAGYSPEKANAALTHWNKDNHPPMEDPELAAVCASAFDGPYDYGCNDPMLSELCDSSCYLKKSSNGNPVIPCC